MSTPNIFTFATSELSQDAFLCWFLSWAKTEYLDKDQSLHSCAIGFIKEIFKKHHIEPPENIERIEITRQDKNIDVLCVINNTYAIIIEDKTNTKDHSNQLERYYKEIESRNFKPKNILPIYYKTEDQGEYSKIEKAGYKPFLRNETIQVLNKYQGDNNILIDYRNHLSTISQKVCSYKSLPINEWSWHSWVGFYLELQQLLGSGEWSYVANPNGGFLGYWWHWQGDKNCEQYLQLEQDQLCFKIWVRDDEDRINLRSFWHRQIINNRRDSNLLLLEKPSRFGNGKFMTVCKHKGDYRVSNDQGVIDMHQTVNRLKEAQNILSSVQISA